MEKEIWKVYKESYCTRLGYLIYEVSSEGNVKINGKLYDFSEQEGYYAIGHFHVHRAVATLFCDNPENKCCVDHINGNKHDNRAINLRWCTHKENMNNPITKAKISPKYESCYDIDQK